MIMVELVDIVTDDAEGGVATAESEATELLSGEALRTRRRAGWARDVEERKAMASRHGVRVRTIAYRAFRCGKLM